MTLERLRRQDGGLAAAAEAFVHQAVQGALGARVAHDPGRGGQDRWSSCMVGAGRRKKCGNGKTWQPG